MWSASRNTCCPTISISVSVRSKSLQTSSWLSITRCTSTFPKIMFPDFLYQGTNFLHYLIKSTGVKTCIDYIIRSESYHIPNYELDRAKPQCSSSFHRWADGAVTTCQICHYPQLGLFSILIFDLY